MVRYGPLSNYLEGWRVLEIFDSSFQSFYVVLEMT
jgi:hypothetical protein